MFSRDIYLDGARDLLQSASSSLRDINYSCGSCGYELNLNSCNRNTSVIGAKYGKSMKKGIISFFSIDESRFNQTEELRYLPYFNSKHSWGIFQRRTKLLCRKCGNYIGIVHKENTPSCPFRLHKSDSTWDGISDHRTYDIKIGALQPLPSEKFSVFDSSFNDTHKPVIFTYKDA